MRWLFGVAWMCVALALCTGAAAAQDGLAARSRGQAPIRLAITVDDLPSSSALPPGYTSTRLVSEIIAALRAHSVRSATGFVIGTRLEADPDARAALALWTGAGYEVGNHTYSHRAIDELGADAYFADVARMEELMRALERESAQRSRYFRYPYLEEGRKEQERKAVMQAIRALGYEVARVSVDFGDWAWGDPYTRCLARGQLEALPRLARSYLQNGMAMLNWSVIGARQVLRRPAPQVLLLHANVATAQNLDALLSEYGRAGAQFIALAEALNDPAFQTDYDNGSGHVLTGASAASARPLPPWLALPFDLLELICR